VRAIPRVRYEGIRPSPDRLAFGGCGRVEGRDLPPTRVRAEDCLDVSLDVERRLALSRGGDEDGQQGGCQRGTASGQEQGRFLPMDRGRAAGRSAPGARPALSGNVGVRRARGADDRRRGERPQASARLRARRGASGVPAVAGTGRGQPPRNASSRSSRGRRSPDKARRPAPAPDSGR
jgi:hypothetical protein